MTGIFINPGHFFMKLIFFTYTFERWAGKNEVMSVVIMIKANISAIGTPFDPLAVIEVSGFLLCQRSNIFGVHSIISCLPTALE